LLQPSALGDFPEIATASDIKLAEHAEVIRPLGKRAIRDIIEIGRRLTEGGHRRASHRVHLTRYSEVRVQAG
jgi:hypothetical protein